MSESQSLRGGVTVTFEPLQLEETYTPFKKASRVDKIKSIPATIACIFIGILLATVIKGVFILCLT